jgi:hypothetical protein
LKEHKKEGREKLCEDEKAEKTERKVTVNVKEQKELGYRDEKE